MSHPHVALCSPTLQGELSGVLCPDCTEPFPTELSDSKHTLISRIIFTAGISRGANQDLSAQFPEELQEHAHGHSTRLELWPQRDLSCCGTASSQALISNDNPRAEGSSWIVINCRKTDLESAESGKRLESEALGEAHRAGSSIIFSTTQINAIYLN